MSGNTPAELIVRSNDLIADLQVHAWDDCGGQPPDTHIAIQAADQLTVLTVRVAELEEALREADTVLGSLDDDDPIKRELLPTISAALTGEQG